MFIIITSILVFALSFSLFKKAAGSMSILKLNTVSYVFYFQIITAGFVGSILVALNVVDYHDLAKPLSTEVKTEAWLWVMYSMIVMPICMLLVNHVFKLNVKHTFNTYINQNIIPDIGSKNDKLILSLIAIFSLSTISYILAYTEHIPLFTLIFKGDVSQALIERVDARRAFLGIDYIKGFFGFMLIPVFTYFSFIYMVIKKRLFYTVIFLVQLITTFILLTYDIQKAPIAFFLLGFLILSVLAFGSASIKKFSTYLAGSILFILIGYSLTTNAKIFDQITRFDSAFYGRVFLTSYFGFPLSLELFPDVISGNTYLSGIPSFILRYFNIEHEESARLLMRYMNPEGVESGTANLISGFYLGEAFANYGYIGLIIAPMVVGVCVQSVHVFLLKNIKQPLIMAFYSSVTVKWLLSAGFVSFLYFKIILFPLIFYWLIKYILKISYKN